MSMDWSHTVRVWFSLLLLLRTYVRTDVHNLFVVVWEGTGEALGSQLTALLTQACPTVFYIPLVHSSVEVSSGVV